MERILISFAALGLLLGSCGFPKEQKQDLEMATALYQQAKNENSRVLFLKSALLFRQVGLAKNNAKAFYNSGVAFLKAQKQGEAMSCFISANRRDFYNKKMKETLEAMRLETNTFSTMSNDKNHIIKKITSYLYVFLVLLQPFLWGFAFFWYRKKRTCQDISIIRDITMAFGVLVTALSVLLIALNISQNFYQEAVIIEESPLYQTDLFTAPEIATNLPEASEIWIKDQRSLWFFVKTRTGLEGWIPAGKIHLVD